MNSAYVVMIETPVEEVITPMRNVNASSAAMTKMISAPAMKKRGGEDGQEDRQPVEQRREARLEAGDDLLDRQRAADFHVFAEELRAGERAVDDVEVHRGGEDEDEDRGETEVGDERPARRRFAEDIFDVGCEHFHGCTS